ncbi:MULTISPECIES: hypothetical protein [unclassified Plantibacter]|uniref:hypothetical protein n=1 Tax=unclassified Plantibacter TaxID=2624265 RepID=UPI003D330B06
MTIAPPAGPVRLGPNPVLRNAAYLLILSLLAGIALALVVQPFYGQDFGRVVIVSAILFVVIVVVIMVLVGRAYPPVVVDFAAGTCTLNGTTVPLRDVTTAWRSLQRDPLALNVLTLTIETSGGEAGRLPVTGVLMRGIREQDVPTLERFITETSIADPDAATIRSAALAATASGSGRRRSRKPRPPRIPMGKAAIIAMLHDAPSVLEADTSYSPR